MKYSFFILITCMCMLYSGHSFSQDDLLSLLGEEEEVTEYITASFKTNRVINLQSLESTAPGVLDIKISHRFGTLNRGVYELFSAENATIRIGADLGITPRLSTGFGRSSFEKTFDGFLKYKILRQSSGQKNMPVTLVAFSSIAINSLPLPRS